METANLQLRATGPIKLTDSRESERTGVRDQMEPKDSEVGPKDSEVPWESEEAMQSEGVVS